LAAGVRLPGARVSVGRVPAASFGDGACVGAPPRVPRAGTADVGGANVPAADVPAADVPAADFPVPLVPVARVPDVRAAARVGALLPAARAGAVDRDVVRGADGCATVACLPDPAVARTDVA
jgi:hypothetical protein